MTLINKIFHKKDYSDIKFRPYIYIKPSLGSSALMMVVLLFPQLFLLALTKSFASLLIVLASVMASMAAEFLYSSARKQFSFSPLFALIQGIVIGLLIPSTYSAVAIFFIAFISLLLCKYAFGGFPNAWANPAVVTVIVAYIVNMQAFPPYMLTGQDWQTRNAALYLIQKGGLPLLSSDAAITAFLNDHVFSIFGVVIPEGYVTLLWDFPSTIPAFRFNLVTLVSSIILFSLDMMDILIPAIFIFFYSLLVRFFLPFITMAPACQGDIILSLLTSGTLFCTLYVLQWYGTTPVTVSGKVAYALSAAVIAFFVMGGGTSPVGYMFTVLFVNLLSLLIQVAESHSARKNIETVIVSKLNALKEVENV